MFCTRCGAKNREGVRFCRSCGKALQATPAQAPTPAPAQAPAATAGQARATPTARWRPKRVALAVLLLGLAAGVVAFILWPRNYEGTFYYGDDPAAWRRGEATDLAMGPVIVSDGKMMCVYYHAIAKATGSIGSKTERGDSVIYDLKTTAYDPSFHEGGYYGPSFKVIVPKGATPDAPYGTWGFVMTAPYQEHDETSSDRYAILSNYLTLHEDGTAVLGTCSDVSEHGAGANTIRWADLTSSDFDPTVRTEKGYSTEQQLAWERAFDQINLWDPNDEGVQRDSGPTKTSVLVDKKALVNPSQVESEIRDKMAGRSDAGEPGRRETTGDQRGISLPSPFPSHFEGSFIWANALMSGRSTNSILLGIKRSGDAVTVYHHGETYYGTVDTVRDQNADTNLITLKDVTTESEYSLWSNLNDATFRLLVPKGASDKSVAGVWGVVIRGTTREIGYYEAGVPIVSSDLLTIDASGEARSGYVFVGASDHTYNPEGSTGTIEDASTIDWADPVSSSYDLNCDAAQRVVTSRIGPAMGRKGPYEVVSAGSGTWDVFDTDPSVPSDYKRFSTITISS